MLTWELRLEIYAPASIMQCVCEKRNFIAANLLHFHSVLTVGVLRFYLQSVKLGCVANAA